MIPLSVGGNPTDPKNIVLVTGSNGRIGSTVMRRLTGRFSDVVGFDRKAPSPPPRDCTHMPVDITSDKSVQEGLCILREHHGTHIAAVVHLAAYYDFLGKLISLCWIAHRPTWTFNANIIM